MEIRATKIKMLVILFAVLVVLMIGALLFLPKLGNMISGDLIDNRSAENSGKGNTQIKDIESGGSTTINTGSQSGN